MADNNYYNTFNESLIIKLMDTLDRLPMFCRDYFVGIEMRTSALTRLNYASDFCVFFHYLTTKCSAFKGKEVELLVLEDLNAVTARDIEYYLAYLSYYKMGDKVFKNKERAKARKLSAVRSLFKYLYNKDLINENVTSKVATPKLHDKEIIRLDSDEVQTMLNNVESAKKFASARQDAYNLHTRSRDIAIVTLLLGTGIRVSECVGLNVTDINLKDNSFLVTRKGGNQSILYFNHEVSEAIADYLPDRKERLNRQEILDEQALFISLQNKRISVRAVENLVKKYARTATPLKTISPHKLRSTFGTDLYKNTKDIYVVAEVLGHKDVNTTKKHYAAISEDIKRAASKKVTLRDDIED
ncbi:MAG: tyrosine-type recombinase/integrase [Bacillota bacterium]